MKNPSEGQLTRLDPFLTIVSSSLLFSLARRKTFSGKPQIGPTVPKLPCPQMSQVSHLAKLSCPQCPNVPVLNSLNAQCPMSPNVPSLTSHETHLSQCPKSQLSSISLLAKHTFPKSSQCLYHRCPQCPNCQKEARNGTVGLPQSQMSPNVPMSQVLHLLNFICPNVPNSILPYVSQNSHVPMSQPASSDTDSSVKPIVSQSHLHLTAGIFSLPYVKGKDVPNEP